MTLLVQLSLIHRISLALVLLDMLAHLPLIKTRFRSIFSYLLKTLCFEQLRQTDSVRSIALVCVHLSRSNIQLTGCLTGAVTTNNAQELPSCLIIFSV